MGSDVGFQPVGWEPMDASWWPAVAAALPLPWPREAALMDLRWWRGQEDATRKLGHRSVASMPGRPALAARWGWTDWAVKTLLRSDEWTDPAKVDSASAPPADRQRSASEPPAAATANAGNAAETASAPPADRQRSASEPPRARNYTDPPITDPPITETTITLGALAPLPPKWAAVLGTEVTTTDAPPVAAVEPTTEADPIADAWTALVAWTPRPAAWKLTTQRRTRLRALTKEHGAPALLTVATWMTTDHDRAKFLRDRGDPDTLLRGANFATYLALAESGPANTTPPAPMALHNPY